MCLEQSWCKSFYVSSFSVDWNRYGYRHGYYVTNAQKGEVGACRIENLGSKDGMCIFIGSIDMNEY